MTAGRLLPLVLLGAIAAASLPACTKPRAATPGAAPMLAVPDAPARVNIPVNPDPPPPAEPPPATVIDKPVTAPPTATTTKPKPTPTPTPSPAAPPPPVADPPTQPVRLPHSDYEDRAKARLGSAQRDLAKVKPAALGQGARAQYESATRFVKMATDALLVKNYLFAFYCADKAATLAELLVKRS